MSAQPSAQARPQRTIVTGVIGSDTHIVGNRIGRVAGAGLSIEASQSTLLVKQNLIRDCADGGVRMSPDAQIGSLAFDNNLVERVGDAPRDGPAVGVLLSSIVDGKVIMGSTGDTGTNRGFVTTYDAETGKQLWRFYTVPGNPAAGFENKAMEMAARTWAGQWWKFGGGGTVWNYAAHNPRLKAAVVCYGPLADTTMLARVQAPVLGVYGQNDGRVNNSLPAIARIMQGLGKSFVADSYVGTGHGFLKTGRNGHGTAEAERAQREIDAFFKAKLGS